MIRPDALGATAEYVLDASALLTLLNRELGADTVRPLVESSVISSVNWAEVLQKATTLGMEIRVVRDQVRSLGLGVLEFTGDDAELAAQLWSTTRQAGLSLGDRACLSLAHRLGLPALTADRAWVALNLDIEVRLIR